MLTKRAVVTCSVGLLGCTGGFVPDAFAQTLIPNPVVWSTGFSNGTFTFIGAVPGVPAGGEILDGVAGHTSLIFQLTLDAGASLDGLKSDNTPGSWVGIALAPSGDANVQGVGWIPGAEPDNLVDFAEALSAPGTTAPWWIMDQTLDAGESSDLFFFSVSSAWIDAAPQEIGFRIVEGPAAATVGVANFFMSCSKPAADVTASVSVTLGTIRLDRRTGHYTQKVTIRNTSSAGITGPISYVLDALTNGTTVLGASGVTACAAPAGSPYVTVSAGDDELLSVRERANLGLEFTIELATPTLSAINYAPRVLAGPGTR